MDALVDLRHGVDGTRVSIFTGVLQPECHRLLGSLRDWRRPERVERHEVSTGETRGRRREQERTDVERVRCCKDPDVPSSENVEEEAKIERSLLGSLSTGDDHSRFPDLDVASAENPAGPDVVGQVGDEETAR